MSSWDVIRLDLLMICGAIYGFLGALAVSPYFLFIKPIIDFFKKLFQ